MKRFWRRGDAFERELRAQRPEPRKEFLRALESRMSGDRDRRPARSLRLGLAGALTVAMLVSLAAFGGLGYAATGVTHAVTAATHVVAPAHKAKAVHKAAPVKNTATPPVKNAATSPVKNAATLSSSQVQYTVTMCFHGHTIQVDSHAVNVLLFLGATLGACSGEPPPHLVTMCFHGHTIQVNSRAVNVLLRLGATLGACGP